MCYPIPVKLFNGRMANVNPEHIAWTDPGRKKVRIGMDDGKVFVVSHESLGRLMERINTIERQGRQERQGRCCA